MKIIVLPLLLVLVQATDSDGGEQALLMAKELRLIGSNTYGQDRRGAEFASAVNLVSRYRGEIETLQTHSFSLDRIEDAFACAADKRSGAIKVTVTP